jgi:hypothetical protein
VIDLPLFSVATMSTMAWTRGRRESFGRRGFSVEGAALRLASSVLKQGAAGFEARAEGLHTRIMELRTVGLSGFLSSIESPSLPSYAARKAHGFSLVSQQLPAYVLTISSKLR